MKRFILLIGTHKGAFLLQSDRTRKQWKLDGTYLKGFPVEYLMADQRGELTRSLLRSRIHSTALRSIEARTEATRGNQQDQALGSLMDKDRPLKRCGSSSWGGENKNRRPCMRELTQRLSL